jgi:SPP1 family predicted phage head-tail adaptor
MLAGRLRYRLQFEGTATGGLVDDGQGGVTMVTQTTVTEVWGSLQGISGREQLEGGQVNARALYQVVIRYRDDITPTMRIKTHDGRLFNIQSVIDRSGRKKELEIVCEEQPAQ